MNKHLAFRVFWFGGFQINSRGLLTHPRGHCQDQMTRCSGTDFKKPSGSWFLLWLTENSQLPSKHMVPKLRHLPSTSQKEPRMWWPSQAIPGPWHCLPSCCWKKCLFSKHLLSTCHGTSFWPKRRHEWFTKTRTQASTCEPLPIPGPDFQEQNSILPECHQKPNWELPEDHIVCRKVGAICRASLPLGGPWSPPPTCLSSE